LECLIPFCIEKLKQFISSYNCWLSTAIFKGVLFIFKRLISKMQKIVTENIQKNFENFSLEFNNFNVKNIPPSFSASLGFFLNDINKIEKWSCWLELMDYIDDKFYDEKISSWLTDEDIDMAIWDIPYDDLRLLLMMIADYLEVAFLSENGNYCYEINGYSFSEQLYLYRKSNQNPAKLFNLSTDQADTKANNRIEQLLRTLQEDKMGIFSTTSSFNKKKRKKKRKMKLPTTDENDSENENDNDDGNDNDNNCNGDDNDDVEDR
jgi:hypothetical protein